MSSEVFRFLSKRKPFSFLPKEELERVAKEAGEESHPAEAILSVQGSSDVDRVFVVKKGMLELFYEIDGKKILSGFLRPGDVCGGIAVLMNSGVAVRTVMAVQDVVLLTVPTPLFRDIANRNPQFHEVFVKIYSKFMMDESYATIMAEGRIPSFLKSIDPFSFLPDEEIESLSSHVSVAHYAGEKIIFVQQQSKIDYLHIIYKGSAERYYEEDGKHKLKDLISEGNIYGGISILHNNGVAVRSLRTCEKTYFYILPKSVFLDICRRYESFTEFFTDTFGKRMLDRSYAEIIAKTTERKESEIRFFNQPVESIYSSRLICCDADTSIRESAAIMTNNRCSSIFIRDKDGKISGIVTDHDFRKKVISMGYDTEKPVSDIMTSPIATLPSKALVFEGLMSMMRKNLKHMAVTDADDNIIGMVTNRDLLMAQGRSPFFILTEINQADDPEALMNKHAQIPEMIKALIAGGAKSWNVTRLITTVTDAILEKFVKFAIDRLGPPPARFVFLIFGSEGRKEQTLKTDQDNAVLYEDIPEEKVAETEAYFEKMGTMVCDWLDEAGYAYCEGNIMAKNPQWRLPLSEWKRQFGSWIKTAEAENLLQASIFFDFRGAYGDMELVDELREYLFDSLDGWVGFFRHLAENALHFKPPLGFFRNFVVESKGEHKDAFDIKAAMMPIVDFARIYALHNAVDETNTLERIHQLYVKKVFSWKDYNDLEQAYSYLMQLRFARQVSTVIEEGGDANNYINPKKLSRLEQTMLKEIFKRIEKFQTKLSFDFIGIA